MLGLRCSLLADHTVSCLFSGPAKIVRRLVSCAFTCIFPQWNQIFWKQSTDDLLDGLLVSKSFISSKLNSQLTWTISNLTDLILDWKTLLQEEERKSCLKKQSRLIGGQTGIEPSTVCEDLPRWWIDINLVSIIHRFCETKQWTIQNCSKCSRW